MAVTTKVARPIDEISQSIKDLGKHVTSLTKENKLLDKSLKFDADPLATLTKRAENTKQAITSLTERIDAMNKKQKENAALLAEGKISKETYDAMSMNIAKAELQLKQLNAEQKATNDLINKLPAKKFEELGSKVSAAGNKIAGLGKSMRGLSVFAAGALAGLGAFGLGAIKNADDLKTMATQLGITAEDLQYLQYIATQTDVPLDKMTNAFKKTRDALGTQLLGKSNEATNALDFLGIDASNFDTDLQAFYALAAALKGVKDGSVQAALANDIFGAKMGSELLPFINAGGKELENYVNQLNNMGILSNQTVDDLSAFDNEINEIKQSFKQAGLEMGVALLPVIQDFAAILKESVLPFVKDLILQFSSLSTESKENIIKILMFTAALAPILVIGGKVVTVIGSIITKLGSMTKKTALASIGWLALGGAVFVAFDLIKNWSKMSTVEKILKTLATAALVAAAAITIFHASWSLGIAIGAIAAGVAMGVAVISSAAKGLKVDMPDVNASGVGSSGKVDVPDYDDLYSDAQSKYNAAESNYNDNSTNNITIVNQAGDSDQDLLDKINKALLLQKQARS